MEEDERNVFSKGNYMNWSKTPNEAGWYWAKEPGKIVYVIEINSKGGMFRDTLGIDLSRIELLLGPIFYRASASQGEIGFFEPGYYWVHRISAEPVVWYYPPASQRSWRPFEKLSPPIDPLGEQVTYEVHDINDHRFPRE